MGTRPSPWRSPPSHPLAGKLDAHIEEVWLFVWFGFFFLIPVRSGYVGSFIELLKLLFFPGGEDKDAVEYHL